MRYFLLLLFSAWFGPAVAQALPPIVTDTATLNFMRWRLSAIQNKSRYRTRLYVYSIPWQDADLGTAFCRATDFRGRLLPIQSADTVGYPAQRLASDKIVWQHAGLAKPIFSLADLTAIKQQYESDSLRRWPALASRIKLAKRSANSSLFILCKFTQPLFSVDGNYAIIWEHKYYKGHFLESQLCLYKRTSATTWQRVPVRLPGQIA